MNKLLLLTLLFAVFEGIYIWFSKAPFLKKNLKIECRPLSSVAGYEYEVNIKKID